jgi:hypothetical protein
MMSLAAVEAVMTDVFNSPIPFGQMSLAHKMCTTAVMLGSIQFVAELNTLGNVDHPISSSYEAWTFGRTTLLSYYPVSHGVFVLLFDLEHV